MQTKIWGIKDRDHQARFGKKKYYLILQELSLKECYIIWF